MPIFFQHQINESTRLGIWKIEETEEYFLGTVPRHRKVTHPHKRLQHLAGRFLLQFLFPGFPYELIQIADTNKPFLPDEQYHFSISHCGDFAAAIVSKESRVGIDIEIPVDKILRIQDKFLTAIEKKQFTEKNASLITLLWSAKESVFKWYGDGAVDFRQHILLQNQNAEDETINCLFSKKNMELTIHYRLFDQIVLSWVVS
jgi:phosphopantetheinyl transferase